VPHLFAAGEAVGGANGANRLSGNAITEALVFGRRAGERAAALAATTPMPTVLAPAPARAAKPDINPAAEIVRLQALMNEHVGPLRTLAGLERALRHIAALAEPCAALGTSRGAFDAEWVDVHDLASMRLVAECIARAALARIESRGAHQRADFPQTSPSWERHQRIRLGERGLSIES